MKRKGMVLSIILICIALVFPVASGSIEHSQPMGRVENEIELCYYDGDLPDTLWGGYNPGFVWQAAIRFTPVELYEYSGSFMTSVRFYHGLGQYQEFAAHEGIMYIYDQGTIYEPGEVLLSEPFVADSLGWIDIALSEPIEIDGTRDIWIGIETTGDEFGNSYFGIGSMPGTDRKSMWIYQNEQWLQLTDLHPGWSFDWFIGAFIDGEFGNAQIEISDIAGCLGAYALLQNIGDIAATDVEWSIEVTGGLLGLIDSITVGSIDILEDGESETVYSDDSVFGFGNVIVTVDVSSGDIGTVEKSRSAFLFGPFLIFK